MIYIHDIQFEYMTCNCNSRTTITGVNVEAHFTTQIYALLSKTQSQTIGRKLLHITELLIHVAVYL